MNLARITRQIKKIRRDPSFLLRRTIFSASRKLSLVLQRAEVLFGFHTVPLTILSPPLTKHALQEKSVKGLGTWKPDLVLLGTRISPPFDWHLDHSSGYRFPPDRFFSDIKPAPERGVDIKVPWELSRFLHAPQRALAARVTGDERFAREAIEQILDWIAKNPWKRGVNWACAMDVALRACNWLLTIDILSDYFEKVTGPEERRAILQSLYMHGTHIFANLERTPTLTSNHYISDLLGLLYLGTYLTGNSACERWRAFAHEELEKEILKQVYEDGADFEASTHYHRLALEIFFFAALLAKRSGNPFSPRYHERLHRMFRFLAGIVQPDGTIPQIGDNDSGRVHVIVPRDVRDMTYLLVFGSIFFADPDLKIAEFPFAQEANALFTREEIETWQRLPARSVSSLESISFPDTGLYVMRKGFDYCAISCGPNGQNGGGGHAHNDKLSFHLVIDGIEFIVDPGTGVYTSYPEIRNEFRSTASHNTVMVDGEEQNRFHPWGVFSLEDDAHATCERWETADERDIFVGSHHGYERLPQRIVHRRAIEFDRQKREFLVTDTLTGSGSASLTFTFVLHPDVEVTVGGNTAVLERSGRRVGLSVLSPGLAFEQVEGRYSPEYGVIEPTTRLVVRTRAMLPFEGRFSIRAL